jgi:hypothetical protein
MFCSSGRRTGQPSEDFLISRTETLRASRGSEYASAPQDLLKAIERADESSTIPAMRFFTLALRFEVDGSPAPSPPASLKHLFTHARQSTGGRSGSCSVGLAFVVITIVVEVIAVMIPHAYL